MKAVIFDIDGTISDNSHRMHYLYQDPPNKKMFHDPETVMRDAVHAPVYELLLQLRTHNHIVIMTARCESERALTSNWLLAKGLRQGDHYSKIYMRPPGDNRPDDVVKRELLEKVKEDGFQPWAAVDDRVHVCRMWREAGVLCIQVAENN